jgi:pyruvate dehydrogenase E1 component beta subunit
MVERLGPGAIRAAARLGQPRVPVPFAPPLEDALKPDADKVVAAAERLMRAG